MRILLLCIILGIADKAGAQHLLYPTQFDLQEVTLLPSVFKDAQDVNYKLLLEYDVDRMLTPFIRQAGLLDTADEKNKYYQWGYNHAAFESWAWNPSMAMDGHIAGHYLSALSLAYASCHDPLMRNMFKQRIDYIIDILNDCQKAFDKDDTGMKGFIGGLPDNEIWRQLYAANFNVYNLRGNWVPLYCEHKIMAGLRDAYVYGGNEQAKSMFKKLCDWSIELVHLFSNDIMELKILQWEPGGINEVLADAYAIFGDGKYMRAAEKYSHQIMIENMNDDPTHTFLDGKHTNEAAAKFVGFARINELSHDDRYQKASRAFWEDVALHRASVIGGVGVNNYFLSNSQGGKYVTELDGPESCTTYNMLKLTERLFSDKRNPKYSDFYERALLNHILPAHDPETGGFSYFTSLHPESYHIYSKVNEAMWCCVGTGMESQSKYGEFIYTLGSDTLFVNLFIASALQDEHYGIKQETDFPYGTTSKLTVTRSGSYSIAVRHPAWTSANYSIKVNGKTLKIKADAIKRGKANYISCGRNWRAGDVIEVDYPMPLSAEACFNSTYISLKYGPIVLAAVTSSTQKGDQLYEVLPNEYAGEGRRDNTPSERMSFKSLAHAPMLICESAQIPQRIHVKDQKQLEFTLDASASGSPWHEVELRPFFAIHHQRYTVYFNHQNESAWVHSALYRSELRTIDLEASTYDYVAVGDDFSEKQHNLATSGQLSGGTLNDKPFRDAQQGQWFEYTMDVQKAAESIQSARDSVVLLCRFYVADRGHQCSISVDGEPAAKYMIPSSVAGIGKEKFFEKPFKLPAWMIQGKKQIKVRFASQNGASFPKLFYVRLIKNDPSLTY